MQYHIELSATIPTNITDEDEAAEQRAMLADPEYLYQLLEGVDPALFTATLVATGDDLPVDEDGPDLEVEEELADGTPIYEVPITLDDLMALPAGEQATITVTEGFGSEYDIEPGEYDSGKLFELLREKGAL